MKAAAEAALLREGEIQFRQQQAVDECAALGRERAEVETAITRAEEAVESLSAEINGDPPPSSNRATDLVSMLDTAQVELDADGLKRRLVDLRADVAKEEEELAGLQDWVAGLVWSEGSEHDQVCRKYDPLHYSRLAPLVSKPGTLLEELRRAFDVEGAEGSWDGWMAERMAAIAQGIDDAKRILNAQMPPMPPGSQDVVFRDLTTEEYAMVSNALDDGNFGEVLAEENNVPVTRKDMQTLRPYEWLNDEAPLPDPAPAPAHAPAHAPTHAPTPTPAPAQFCSA